MNKFTSDNYFINKAHEIIASSRYYLKDSSGAIVENNIFETFRRVNDYIFQNDPEHKDNMQQLCEQKKFIYAGRPLAQAGTGIKQLFNCFVLGIDDSRAAISETQRIHFHVQAHGGGTGINFSKLRPSGSWCKGANARSSGPEGFITAMSALSSNISQGGNRSGANLGLLEDWHPGLLKFITKKSQGNWENIRKFAVIIDENKFNQWQWVNPYQWQTFNVSVALSDEFMRQVKRKAKKPWKLHWKEQEWALWDYTIELQETQPDKDDSKTIIPITICAPDEQIALHEAQNQVPFRNGSALTLNKGPYHITAYEWFNKICTNAWKDGCPGIFFIDRAREYHNGEYFNKLDACNPCHRGNSLVHTDKGLIRIKNLVNEIFTILTPTGELAKAICFPSGVADIYRVRFKRGGYIDLTTNHNLIDYESKKKVQVKNLISGQKLFAPTVPIAPLNSNFQGEESDGFLLGWIFGDGCIFQRKRGKDKGRISLFTIVGKSDNTNIADFIIKRLNQLKINKRRTLHWCNKNGNLETNCSDKGVINWFCDRYLLTSDKSKGLPKSILEGNRELQKGFLAGLFASDGCVSKVGRKIILTSSREEVVFHVKCLLNTFGINSTYRIYNIPHSFNNRPIRNFIRCDLTITGVEAIKFFERIGFGLHERKNNLCKKWTGRIVKTDKNYVIVDKVTNILTKEDVYNITVDNSLHQYIVNNIASANCGEEILPQWSVCCLSSLILPGFVAESGTILWDELENAVHLSVRALNHIIDLNKTDIKKIDDNTKLERRIGLGTIGIAELLIMVSLRTGKDLRYSTSNGRAFVKKILKFIKHTAYQASIELAKEVGPFPAFDYDKFIESKFMQQLLKERPDIDKALKKHGIANVTILTSAPTGTTGTITGYSSGCEPYFAMAYHRNSNVGTIIDGCPSFLSWLKNKNINYADYNFNMKELRKHKHVPKVFEEAHEIHWKDHLAMQAVFAEQIDASVSKTINLSNEATVEDIMQTYIGAFNLGIKSTTVYRDGSKTQILEHFKSIKEIKNNRPQKIVTLSAPKRPEQLVCDIHTVSIKGEHWKVLVGLLYNRPYETFCFPETQIELPTSKTEGLLVRNGNGKYRLVIPYGTDNLVIKDVASFLLTDEHKMITRLLSTSLRHGAPLAALVAQLSKCEGEVTTFSKALMRVLKKYISDEEFIALATCSECHGKHLINEDGCYKCIDCGFNGCG